MLSVRPIHVCFILASVAALLWLGHIRAPLDSPLTTKLDTNTGISNTHHKPLRRRHVAVATQFGFHYEVYGAFAWTVAKVFEKQNRPSSVHIYAQESDFLSLLMRLGLLRESMMRSPNKEEFIADIRSTTLFPDDPGAMIDFVTLPTCEIDLGALGPDLLQAWDARPADKKFTLVCGVHHGLHGSWANGAFREWSKRGALRLLPISDHVAAFFKKNLDKWADSRDPADRLAFYEYIKINTYYPVTDLTNFPMADKSGGVVPCTGVLEGSFEKFRRDYDRVFSDLVRLIREDPRGWGYQWSNAEKKYLPDSSAPNPPFVLHLLGRDRGGLDIPPELERVVIKDVDLEMKDFYTLLQTMDIAIPGFSDEGSYYTAQASSVMHTSLGNHVPILATRAMWEAYPHIAGSPSILRPASLSEMEAIGLLRGAKINSENPNVSFSGIGSAYSEANEDCVGPSEFCQDVQAMLQKGWKRTRAEWDRHLKGIWEKNEKSVGDMLRDI